MITHSRKRSFYNWVARLLTLVLMLSTASQLSLANSFYGEYTTILPIVQGEFVPISQQTLSSSSTDNGGKYGTEILSAGVVTALSSPGTPTYAEDYFDSSTITDFQFYKFDATTGAREEFADGDLTPSAITGSSSEYLKTQVGNVTINVGSDYIVYVKQATTTTERCLEIKGTATIIVEGLNFLGEVGKGEQAILMSDSSAGHDLILKGSNYAISASYSVDVKKKMTVYGYDENASLTAISEGGFNGSTTATPGIRVVQNSTGGLTIQSGNITAVSKKIGTSQSAGIGNTSASGKITINGGTVKAEGYVGIGAGSVQSSYPITINGGDVVAIGTRTGLGCSGYISSTLAGDVIINGGTVYAYGGVYGIQTYGNGSTQLNGGIIHALTGNTNGTSIGVTSVSGTVVPNTGDLYANGTGGGAVLFRNGTTKSAQSSSWNMAVFLVNNTDFDPYNSYYGNSLVSSVEETSENIWYGRVYGKVSLAENLTMGATTLTTYSYDDSLKTFQAGTVIASCDGMLLDIPPTTADTFGNVKNQFRTVVDDTNLLVIEAGSTLRFKAVPVAEPTGLTEGSKDFSSIETAMSAAYENTHYQWSSGSPAPVDSTIKEEQGTIQVILSSDLIWDTGYYASSATGTPNILTVTDGTSTYHSESPTSSPLTPNGAVGMIYINEAGHGNFWSTGVASMSYRLPSDTGNLGWEAVATTGVYPVTLQPMTSGRYWSQDGSFSRNLPSTGSVSIELLEQGYGSFTVEPFDITNSNITVNNYTMSVAFNDSKTATDLFEIDANGQLKIKDVSSIGTDITVSNPFNSSKSLVYGTDYALSYEENTDQSGLGDNELSIFLKVIGIGNYTGEYVDETDHTLDVASGSLGGVTVQIDLGEDDPTANPIFVKPDGEADFSVLKITSTDGTKVYFDGSKPNETTVLSAKAENVNGTLFYDITISINKDYIAGTEFAVATDDDLAQTLSFAVEAIKAGEGSTFDSGSLNLVTTFYQRPDCALYPDDFLVYENGTILSRWTDYTLEYYDGEKWNVWTEQIDCEDVTEGKCDVVPDTENVATGHFSDQFQVRVTSKKDSQDSLEFNATWATGGSVPGHTLNQGMLYTYQNSNKSEAVYVAEGYGVVLSAEKLDLFGEIYEVKEEGDETTTVAKTTKMTDNDFSYVTVLSDFVSYQTAILDDDNLIDYYKSFLYCTYVNENGETINSIQEEGALSLQYFTEKYIQDGHGVDDLKWYLCLAGTGAYSGRTAFEIDPAHIVFVDILEDLVGILDDNLILNPNTFPSGTEIYQKPDGTLHNEDLKTLMHRMPVLDSNYAINDQTLSGLSYSVTAAQMTAQKTSIASLDENKPQYLLTITGYGDSSLLNVIQGTTGNTPAEPVYRQAEHAGTGDSFRHGYIDLVEDSYQVKYVSHSGVDLDGDDLFDYSSSEQQEILAQISFYHKKDELEDYDIQFITPFVPEGNSEYQSQQVCTVLLTDTRFSSSSETASVSFEITIEMEEEESGYLYYQGNGTNVANVPNKSEYALSESFEITENIPNQVGYTFDKWTLDKAGTVDLPDESDNVKSLSQLLAYAKLKSIEPEENSLILYAQWESNVYKVTFDANSGKLGEYDEIEQSGSFNEPIEFPDNPTRTGYAFDGWSITSAGTTAIPEGTTYGTIATDTVDYKEYTGKLWAIWTELEPYHIYFDLNYDGGGITHYIEIIAEDYSGETKLVLPTAPTREGYLFKGWQNADSDTVTGETAYKDLGFATVKDEDNDDIENVAMLYAQWQPNSYTVYFESDGADLSGDKIENLNWFDPIESTDFPEVTKEGYSFTGWLVKGKTDRYFTEKMSFSQLADNDKTTNVTLVAQWQEDFKDPVVTPPTVTPPVVTPPAVETPEPEPEPETEPEEENSGNTGDSGRNSGGSSDGSTDYEGSSSENTGNDETSTDVSDSTVSTTLATTVEDDKIQATILPEDMDNAVSQGLALGNEYDILFEIPSSGSIGHFEANWSKEVYTIFQESDSNSLSFMGNGVLVTFDRDAVDYLSGKTSSTGSISIQLATGDILEEYGTRPVYDISMKTGNTEITALDSGLMKITMPYKDTKTGNLIAGRTQGNDVDYVVKSFHDGSYMKLLAEDFGQFGIVTRENTDTMFDYIGSWTENYVNFVDARRLYVIKDAISMDESITRAMFVAMLGEMEGAGNSVYSGQFSDVDKDSPYAPYIQWASSNGIVFGKGNGRFDPDAAITREEIAVMLQSYVEYLSFSLETLGETDKFMDEGTISHWAIDAVKVVQDYGLVHGYVNNLYKPYDSTTYAEHAVMLMRLIETMVSAYTLDIF